MSHRHNIIRWNCLQLIDKIHDFGQFGHNIAKFIVVQLETGECRYVVNLFFR